jgi:GT2 family glycosyltransferase
LISAAGDHQRPQYGFYCSYEPGAAPGKRGHYLLQLNPDTLVPPGAIQTLLELRSLTSGGHLWSQSANADGSLQKVCRCGDRIWAVFTISGCRAFPAERVFGALSSNHPPDDAINPVDGVAGSCMLIRASRQPDRLPG